MRARITVLWALWTERARGPLETWQVKERLEKVYGFPTSTVAAQMRRLTAQSRVNRRVEVDTLTGQEIGAAAYTITELGIRELEIEMKGFDFETGEYTA